jgi:Flp pilus assembly protein TadD
MTWVRAGGWALATLDPGAIPAPAEFERFMEGAAGLEAVGQHEAAARAYAASASRWPEQTLPQLGMANLAYARGDLARADRLLAGLLQRAPGDLAAGNNRALVLLELGCPQAARQQLAEAERLADDGPFAAPLAATRRRVDADRRPDGPACTHDVEVSLAQ